MERNANTKNEKFPFDKADNPFNVSVYCLYRYIVDDIGKYNNVVDIRDKLEYECEPYTLHYIASKFI